MSEPGIKWVRIRFLKAWGHPTRNEVYGPGSGVVRVSEWIAGILTKDGTAEIVTE